MNMSQRISVGSQLLKFGVPLFVAGAFLEGLFNLLSGVALVMYRPLGALGIIYGILGLVLGVMLIPYIKRYQDVSVDSLRADRRVPVMVFIVAIMLIVDGVARIFFRAPVPGVTEILGGILGAVSYMIWVKQLIRSPSAPLITGVLVLITGIFLAIAGFMSSIIVVNMHVGVISISMFLIAIVGIAAAFTSPEFRRRLVEIIAYIIVMDFASALVVGGAMHVWSALRYIGWGGMFTAAASIGVVSGIVGLIAGVMILISSI